MKQISFRVIIVFFTFLFSTPITYLWKARINNSGQVDVIMKKTNKAIFVPLVIKWWNSANDVRDKNFNSIPRFSDFCSTTIKLGRALVFLIKGHHTDVYLLSVFNK